jgi:uncharacterized membrane protein YhaH (DUF805 family)
MLGSGREAVVGPVRAVAAVLRHPLRFSGRASLPEFWWWVALVALVVVGLRLAGPDRTLVTVLGEGVGAAGLAALALLPTTLAVTGRRLRDAGLSPWWLVLYAVPLGSIVVLTMCSFRSWQPSTVARPRRPRGLWWTTRPASGADESPSRTTTTSPTP